MQRSSPTPQTLVRLHSRTLSGVRDGCPTLRDGCPAPGAHPSTSASGAPIVAPGGAAIMTSRCARWRCCRRAGPAIMTSRYRRGADIARAGDRLTPRGGARHHDFTKAAARRQTYTGESIMTSRCIKHSWRCIKHSWPCIKHNHREVKAPAEQHDGPRGGGTHLASPVNRLMACRNVQIRRSKGVHEGWVLTRQQR